MQPEYEIPELLRPPSLAGVEWINEESSTNYKLTGLVGAEEVKDISKDLTNSTDPGIFKNDFEKDLFKKINELRKYFSGISKTQNFDDTLVLLSTAKKEIFAFFDNVKVNDDNEIVKKNRLELINFFCKTYENFIDFRLIKDIND